MNSFEVNLLINLNVKNGYFNLWKVLNKDKNIKYTIVKKKLTTQYILTKYVKDSYCNVINNVNQYVDYLKNICCINVLKCKIYSIHNKLEKLNLNTYLKLNFRIMSIFTKKYLDTICYKLFCRYRSFLSFDLIYISDLPYLNIYLYIYKMKDEKQNINIIINEIITSLKQSYIKFKDLNSYLLRIY